MKAFVVLAVIVSSTFAAPVEDGKNSKLVERSSSYGSYGASPPASYGVPPSAPYGAPAPYSAPRPYGSPAPYGGPAPYGSPVSLYLAQPRPPVPLPHYRENEHKDSEHAASHPSARSYYDSVPLVGASASASASVSSVAGLSPVPAPPAGPAVGLFPHANVGNCAVPLLLSCSPKVVSGHIASSGYGSSSYSGSGYNAPAYRSAPGLNKNMELEKARSSAESPAHHNSMNMKEFSEEHHTHTHMHNKHENDS